MSRPPSANGGLCRCLCSAFKETTRRATVKPSAAAFTQIRARPSKPILQPRWSQRRLLGTATAVSVSGDIPPLTTTKEDDRQALEAILAPRPPTEKQLEKVPTATINDALALIRDPEGSKLPKGDIDRHQRILQLVEYLIQNRKVRLSSFIYECMMDAMADPQGSASGVHSLFWDMENEGIQPTETICKSALVALAVHPDYTLREQVISIMQEHWFSRDQCANEHILLGLLRDKQYELAYGKLFQMVESKVHVTLWVFDIFILVFGQQGFLDEMLQLFLRRKHAKGSDAAISNLLYFILDTCSQVFHYQGTVFAWNSAFRTGDLQAPDGVLENVLATAAKQGDVDLATEVYGIISSRRKVQIHHYEALAEAFMNDGNMASTLSIFNIMHRDGVPLSRGGTRGLVQLLLKDASLISELEAAVRATAKDSQVPPAIVAVLVEVVSHLRGSEAAMELYRDIDSLTGEPPDVFTMQNMIVNSRGTATTRTLLDSYKKRFHGNGDPPLRLEQVNNQMIAKCLELGELDMAMSYALQALDARRTEEYPWLRLLAQEAVAKEDTRVWEMMDKLEEAKNQDALEIVQRVIRLRSMKRKWDERQDTRSAIGR
jgi:hypothetical protein